MCSGIHTEEASELGFESVLRDARHVLALLLTFPLASSFFTHLS